MSYWWKNILDRFTVEFCLVKCSQINESVIFHSCRWLEENNFMLIEWNILYFFIRKFQGRMEGGPELLQAPLMDLACLLTPAGTEEQEHLWGFAEKQQYLSSLRCALWVCGTTSLGRFLTWPPFFFSWKERSETCSSWRRSSSGPRGSAPVNAESCCSSA